jgi:hypothetical protein
LLLVVIVVLVGGLVRLASAIYSGFSFKSNKALVDVVMKMEKEVSEMGKLVLEMKKKRLGRHGQ